MGSGCLAAKCVPSTFATPDVFGTSILSIEASLVSNYSDSSPFFAVAQPIVPVANLTFCNVTVSYTHPGSNDKVYNEAWLPIEGWNGRLQAVGGGGYAAGRFILAYNEMEMAVNAGYATISTDAGLEATINPADPGNINPEEWALLSTGNLNLYKQENFGGRSLQEEAVIAKSLIKSFYGKNPEYSYWTGCSQGGRQGMALAQQYPDIYDGIIAGAPAIHLTEVIANIYWPQQYMNDIGEYPASCEIDAITAAAMKECDALDGVMDGMISDTEACLAKFDPASVVGTIITCPEFDNAEIAISSSAAKVAKATWSGMISSTTGERIWYGLDIGSDITGNSPTAVLGGTANTTCVAYGNCVGNPHEYGPWFIRTFLAKDLNFDPAGLKHAEWETLLRKGIRELYSYYATDDADLSDLKNLGRKMISFHGLADNIIPSSGSKEYYKDVHKLLPDVRDFYRHYRVPGLGHCVGGNGAIPTSLFDQLRDWVERGVVPESSPLSIVDQTGEKQDRIICPYPEVATFDPKCGKPGAISCWACVEGPW